MLWIKEKDGTKHSIWKYLISEDGEESVWSHTWYGRHVIGNDCEWLDETPAHPTAVNGEWNDNHMEILWKLLYNAEFEDFNEALEYMKRIYKAAAPKADVKSKDDAEDDYDYQVALHESKYELPTKTHDDDKQFKQYVRRERDAFVRFINELEWNRPLRTACENLLIAYDQMRDRL